MHCSQLHKWCSQQAGRGAASRPRCSSSTMNTSVLHCGRLPADYIPLFEVLMPIILPLDVFTMDAYIRLEYSWLADGQVPSNPEQRDKQELYLLISFMSALRFVLGNDRPCTRHLR